MTLTLHYSYEQTKWSAVQQSHVNGACAMTMLLKFPLHAHIQSGNHKAENNLSLEFRMSKSSGVSSANVVSSSTQVCSPSNIIPTLQYSCQNYRCDSSIPNLVLYFYTVPIGLIIKPEGSRARKSKATGGAGAPSQRYTVHHPCQHCQQELKQIHRGVASASILSTVDGRSSWQPVL